MKTSQARAAERVVDTSFFYDRLAPHGQWFKHVAYGWVWHPNAVAVGWRPYTVGHWVWTDDAGWLWDSDEDWGWATYHYGRWFYDSSTGWVWTPGTIWAPAWVSWRYGGGYVGWAPLPPNVVWDVNSGFPFSEFQIDAFIPIMSWVFVSEPRLTDLRLRDHVFLPARNVSCIDFTRNVTKFENLHGRIFNHGADLTHIEKSAGHVVAHETVREVDTPAESHVRRGTPGQTPVYRPNVKAVPTQRTPPQSQDHSRTIAAARADLHERQDAERRALQEIHAREQGQPELPEPQLQQRHHAEIQAQKQQHEVEQREFSGRVQQSMPRQTTPGRR